MTAPGKLTDHQGRTIDFGKTSADYDQHRPGFPSSMYDRLLTLSWIRPGDRVLDLGTGTGSLAIELAKRRLEVVALDPSTALLAIARRRASELGLDVRFVEGTAENTHEDPASFDLVTAGQCWWWFDGELVIAEAKRILRPGGRLLIANFCYLPMPGTAAGQTEELILEHNPGWPKARESGIFDDQVRDVDRGGFREIESFSYVESVPFTHEAWRGRIRACNGVGAALPLAQVDVFDRELAKILASQFPSELMIPHRVFVVTART